MSDLMHAKFGGFYGCLGPKDSNGNHIILWNQTTKSDMTRVLVDQPDSRYAIRFQSSPQPLICFLGRPDQPIQVNGKWYVRCFETRPTDARGGSESPCINQIVDATGARVAVSAMVEYVEGPNRWFSCAVTLEAD